MSPLNLTIDGMSCGHCLNAVKNALTHLPGVKLDTLSMGRAKLEYDPAAVSESQITQAVTDAGYRAHVVPA